MKITQVTLTGADDNTPGAKLIELSEKYPFVEWGVLFSKSRAGLPRYPTEVQINLLASCKIPLAAHFCGWHSQQILEKQQFGLFNYWDRFTRFQLNYNFSTSSKHQVHPLINWAEDNPGTAIILQVNNANKAAIEYIDQLNAPANIHFLYDSSGGRGMELKEIKPPYKNYTGYSGGINLGNIKSTCKNITGYPNPVAVWIDMESGLRSLDDKFDLGKCSEVLDACQEFVS